MICILRIFLCAALSPIFWVPYCKLQCSYRVCLLNTVSSGLHLQLYLHIAGFLVQEESIDRQENTGTSKQSIPGQTINIYTKSWSNPNFIPDKGQTSINSIDNEAIYKVLQPYIPQITQIVKDNRNQDEFNKLYPNQPTNKEPMLQWIFFRKYAPTAQRNSLKHHVDTNINTVNIELSNDYVGGGLFIIKQFSSNNSIANEYYEEKSGYEWINTIKRVNTSDIIFPELHAGDAIFYDYSVRHGVAPIESGIRYSMAFFYDWVKESLDVDIRSYLSDIELDFVLVYEAELGREKFSMLFEKITTEIITYEACEGDIIHVYKSGTNELVTKIEIKRDQHYYKISDETESDPNEFGIKLHNQLDIDLDIVLSYDAAQQRKVWKDLYLDVTPDEEIIYHAYDGDILQVFIAKTDEEVAKLVINRDQYLYPIQQGQMKDTAGDSEEL